MEKVTKLIKQYLSVGRAIQLATSVNDIPWISTVYYVVDEKQNIYWLSYPSRRHSQDIAVNSNVALTLVVKQDIPVIGVQAQGTVALVERATTVAKIMFLYIKKYGAGKSFYKNFNFKTNKHSMYCFTPSKIILFDELNFGSDNSQEINM